MTPRCFTVSFVEFFGCISTYVIHFIINVSVNLKITRSGEYKCVVEKDGKTSEGTFDVTLAVVEEDLIEAADKKVNSIAGGIMHAQVLKISFDILLSF